MFNGVQITVSCENWEQVNTIGEFWECLHALPKTSDEWVGVGRNWIDNTFEYAIGMFDRDLDERIVEKLLGFPTAKRISFDLPKSGWHSAEGKTKDLQMLYECDLDCNNKRIKYEVERFSGDGNCRISVVYEK
jgi:hypothetical protein